MTKIEFVPVDLIDPHPHNPRRELGDLTELADSIREQGIQQNLLLVPNGEDRYTAVIGHRRLAAAKLAELEDVPAVVNPRLSESEQIRFMIIENVQRENLSPVEEAEGYQQLLDLGMKVRTIAKTSGRSEKTVTARLRLMRLPVDAREKVHLHQASLEDAAELQKLEDRPDLYAKVAAKLGDSNFSWALREALDARKRDMERVPLLARLAELGIALASQEDRERPYDTVGRVETVEELAGLEPDLPEDLADVRYTAPEYDTRIFLRRLTVRDADAEAARRAERETLEAERARILAEGDAMYAHRDEWVRGFCGRKRIAAKDQLCIVAVVAPVVLAGGIRPSSYEADEWLRPGVKTDYPDLHVRLGRVWEAFPTSDPSVFLLAALHVAAGVPWKNAHERVETVALYGLLEQLGYPVSDAERARITPPADDEAEDGEA